MGPEVKSSSVGKQSEIEFCLHGVTRALREVGRVLYTGEQKYGRDNWRHIDIEGHLSHAVCHIFEYINGDREEDHLVNAVCRLLFAKEMSVEKPGAVYPPKPSVADRIVERLEKFTEAHKKDAIVQKYLDKIHDYVERKE